MSTTDTGHHAEETAAIYLQKRGFRICDRNWRTKVCEIDIVAEKDNCLHFVEVKYREHDSQGSGLEYITPSKIRRMRFAAELYVAEKKWNGNINLAGIEVSGPEGIVTDFIESISYDF